MAEEGDQMVHEFVDGGEDANVLIPYRLLIQQIEASLVPLHQSGLDEVGGRDGRVRDGDPDVLSEPYPKAVGSRIVGTPRITPPVVQTQIIALISSQKSLSDRLVLPRTGQKKGTLHPFSLSLRSYYPFVRSLGRK